MRVFLPTLALTLLAAAGCGPSKIPVTGKLSLKKGGPLPGGMILFAPVGGGAEGGARGYVKEDGTFTLSTDKEGDGTLAGKYKLLVVPPSKKGGEDMAAGPPPIDPKYGSYDTSGLEAEISADKHHFEFTLDPPTRR